MRKFVRLRNFFSLRLREIRRNRISRTAFFLRVPQGSGDPLLLQSRTHINLQRKFVYSRIPKAANSTVIATIYSDDIDRFDRDVIEATKQGDKGLASLDEGEITELQERFFIFTFVRHPFVRFLSAYMDKIAKPGVYRRSVSRRINLRSDGDVSIDDFIGFLEDRKNLMLDAHWAPQATLLGFPLERYDLIGSVENFSSDLASLCRALKMDARELPYVPHATGATAGVMSLSEEQLSRVHGIYEHDFELLGYTPQLSAVGRPPKISKIY